MMHNEKDAYDDIAEEGLSEPSICVRERDTFGTDHILVGQRVCERWSLPNDVTGVVLSHHVEDPWQADCDPVSVSTVQLGLKVANFLLGRRDAREEQEAEVLRAGSAIGIVPDSDNWVADISVMANDEAQPYLSPIVESL